MLHSRTFWLTQLVRALTTAFAIALVCFVVVVVTNLGGN